MTSTINASLSAGVVVTSDTSGSLALQTAGTTAVTIDTSQNVGIGTSSPAATAMLEVSRSTTVIPTATVTADAQVVGWRVRRTGGSYPREYYMGIRENSTSLDFYDNTADALRARINSSGVVMVGTTSTTPAGSGDTKGISLWTDGSSSQIFSTGNGDTAAVFNRAGSDGALIRTRRQGSDVGSISVTSSATAYNTSSDYRLKENIAPMTGALDTVAQLKPVTYKWKSDGSDGQGFIAHELQEIVPDCVVGEKDAVDADGNPQYQGIDTSFLVATLCAAIKEQQVLITNLQADIAAIKAGA